MGSPAAETCLTFVRVRCFSRVQNHNTWPFASEAHHWLRFERHSIDLAICSSSTKATCLAGVSQGSFLGPLWLSAYVCPLSHITAECSVHHHSYSDDLFTYCTLLSSQGASNTGDNSQATLVIERWYIENGMLSTFKFDVITFSWTFLLTTLTP